MDWLLVHEPVAPTPLPAVAWICVWAYLGVAARVLLTTASSAIEATQAAPSILTAMGVSFFLPNVVGCFVMGLAQPLKTARHEAFWTGVTTGFCGCCTTFASWELVLAQQYLGSMAANATLMFFVQLTTSLASFLSGRHLGLLYTDRHHEAALGAAWSDVLTYAQSRSVDQESDGTWQRLALALEEARPLAAAGASTLKPVRHGVVYGLCGVATLIAVTLAALYLDGYLAVVFGPPGALLRYGLGLRLNKSKTFPLGTFAANVSASIVSCIGVLAMPTSALGATWIQHALLTGFCGSLSTVSSWINEIYSMPSSSLVYVAATHVATQTACLLLLGTL
ncbi:hypothetical protein SPRG_15836 [Saprolegnia parasitica CBS 223.65]|uniref:Fluoride ion transporter CrcB n=1 Tax=Saprolegnia parasitica (strain CBS 223.65) TaxID=695850 RepID=A0A067BK93_SAPPC|nr:hypothetical protein SPRG_15836 [Saprolegnia parasitica CBS 223.65]KDO18884.1 hypothetical protein SPRG_15836 [Saprolegnia parasitica CBS 223.65]|eukprot:XP_012210405.1 hypothetical protein SPRG_15836 [Saprolegnia parasitica CBS 223.65]